VPPFLGALIYFMVRPPLTMEPVSYTHLDVYKRQPIMEKV